MKTLIITLLSLSSCFVWMSCQRTEARYIDLATGEPVVLEENTETGEMVNVETGKPVRLYVNTTTKDTIFAPTGKIVNNEVILTESGMYVYADDEEYKLKLEKDGGYKEKWGDDNKVEVEKDGDVTIKKGDVKIKVDGETGERKVKVDD
jgi:hypothetical protein